MGGGRWLPWVLALLMPGWLAAAEPGRVWIERAPGTPAVSFAVEIVHTPEEISRGLMFRAVLPPERGMLFRYPESAPRYFWMKNVVLPLDILFIDGGKIRAIREAVPCLADPCAIHRSGQPVATVLEIGGGLARKLGLMPGQGVFWQGGPEAAGGRNASP